MSTEEEDAAWGEPTHDRLYEATLLNFEEPTAVAAKAVIAQSPASRACFRNLCQTKQCSLIRYAMSSSCK